MKPYAEIDGITIYHGRMEDVWHLLPQADAILTDPPYKQTSLKWDVWPTGWPSLAKEKTNSLWCFGTLRMFTRFWPEFSDWKMSHDIVWEKHNGSGSDTERFKRVHEQAAHFYRGPWEDIYKSVPKMAGKPRNTSHTRSAGPAHFNQTFKPAKYTYTTERYARSVIPVNSCHGIADNETQKPEGIIAPLLEYCCPTGGLVIDCFAGSGTTGVIARRQGKRAILIDMRECQCEAAARRLSVRELFTE